MNDFTKEELEDLMFCVTDHIGYQGDSIHENLINKLQSMIDNYCEIKLPTVDNYVCPQCNEEWIRCECKEE